MGAQKSTIFDLCLRDNSIAQEKSLLSFGKLFSSSNLWQKSLKSLKKELINSLKNLSLLSQKAWQTIFSTLQGYYLNQNEKIELLSILTKIVKVNFEGDLYDKQFVLCGSIGQKLHNFETRLYFKHKHSLQHCKFESDVTKESILPQSLNKQFQTLQSIIDKGYINDIKSESRNKYRNANQINFYFKGNHISQAEILIQKWKIQDQDNDSMLHLKGQIKLRQGKQDEALVFFEKCLQIREKKFGKESFQCASPFNYIGICNTQLGNYQKALQFYQKSKICQQKKTQVNNNFVELNNNIGQTYFKLGLYAKGLQFFEKSLQESQTVNGKQSSKNIASMMNMAVLYRNKDDYEKAVYYNQRCLKLIQKNFGKESVQYASILNNLGLVYECQNLYSKALQCYEKNIQIHQKIQGKDSFRSADSINNKGLVYLGQSKYQQAIQSFQKSLKIYEKHQGKQSLDCAIALNNIGEAQRMMINNSKALENYQKSLKIFSSIMGENSLECASPLLNMGVVYDYQGDLKKAKQFYGRALEIQIKVKGQKSIDVSLTYYYLALSIKKEGDLQKSLEYAKKSYEIRKALLGDNHPKTQNSLTQVNSVTSLIKSK